MYSYEEIRHVHLEPTTRCNAGCPMCARNAFGAKLPGLPLTSLSAADFARIFEHAFLEQLTGVDMCGAYGDPAASPELLEIIRIIRQSNPACTITVYSNGGLRTSEFWQALALALGQHGKLVVAIDGLADTNAIHRRNVSFDRVIENASAFIAAGGTARWEFLIFKHNEHQLELARQLSEDLGFSEFSAKKSSRFLEPEYDYVPEMEGQSDLSRFPIYDRRGQVVGQIEPPKNPNLINRSVSHYSEIVQPYGSLDALLSATPIQCRVLDTKSVFVSATGTAFPCCWTYVQATRPAYHGRPNDADRQMIDMIERTGGFARLDARLAGLRAVVESPLFAAVEASWSCSSVKDSRLRVCARACGTAFPAYFDQFVEPALLPRGLQAPSPAEFVPPVARAQVSAAEARE